MSQQKLTFDFNVFKYNSAPNDMTTWKVSTSNVNTSNVTRITYHNDSSYMGCVEYNNCELNTSSLAIRIYNSKEHYTNSDLCS